MPPEESQPPFLPFTQQASPWRRPLPRAVLWVGFSFFFKATILGRFPRKMYPELDQRTSLAKPRQSFPVSSLKPTLGLFVPRSLGLGAPCQREGGALGSCLGDPVPDPTASTLLQPLCLNLGIHWRKRKDPRIRTSSKTKNSSRRTTEAVLH